MIGNKPLRVGIDLLPLASLRTGVAVYLLNTLRAIFEEDDSLKFFHANYCSRLSELRRRRQLLREGLGPQSERLLTCRSRWFPGWELLRRAWPIRWSHEAIDLFHFTSPSCLLSKPSIPYAITVYDLAWLRVEEIRNSIDLQPALRRLPSYIQDASVIFAISETTAADIIDLMGVSADRIVVTPLAVRPELSRPKDDQERQAAASAIYSTSPYFLCLGTAEPRKNYVRLLEAFAVARQRGLKHHLVFVGGSGPDQEKLEQLCTRRGLNACVRFFGYLDDKRTREAFWGASALLMPSLYEGFGLPTLEAMACGIRVMAASAGALPEVVGCHARMVDPYEVDSMVEGLLALEADRDNPSEWRCPAMQWAASYSWQETARRTISGYRSCIS
jgi:glycosyltransferase involved in cell wall biosynthesis